MPFVNKFISGSTRKFGFRASRPAPPLIAYLVIGAGGGGGRGSNPGAYHGGGGGGGGGSYVASYQTVSGTSYSITVGAGQPSNGGGVAPSSGFGSTSNGGVTGNGGAGCAGSTANGGTAYTGGNGGPGFFFYNGSPPQPGYTPPAISGSSTTYGAGGPVLGGSGGSGTGNGGGGGDGVYDQFGGSGGSGIVIIRYANTFPLATSTTGSPTYSSAQSGYHTYTFSGSGSITW